MKLGVAFGKLLSGESVIRDFLTIGVDDNVREKVYLRTDDQLLDVTRNQWLLGLDPRIIGIWSEQPIPTSGSYTLYFRDDPASSPDTVGHHALGILKLDYVDRLVENNGNLFLFRVQSSTIHHIDGLRARLLYRKFYKKPGVDFQRLKAVAAAYTYPRRVRIISFQLEGNYNYIFPMDLLADIKTSGRYLLGMRHSNQVLKKIMDIRKIVVAEAPARYKPLIYSLGRNHSAAPPPLNELPFATLPTRNFGFQVPEWVESYKEITIDKTLDLGSHMLLCGQWKEDVLLKPATPRLHHIHFLHFLYLKHKGLNYPIIP
ncbi:hypothetical protein [Puia sp.]|jgi:hypothetical protein|uniref:hypothetical protein n=1 Tax=Puia sp. TaxID=2045100 RepID=UPI002F3FC41D